MKEELDSLMKLWKPVDASLLPQKVPADALEINTKLFQYRWGMDEGSGVSDFKHVEALMKTLQETELDPVLVLHVAGRNIVMDGHHRLAAYERVQRDIPVVYFTGTPKESLLAAGYDNNKDRLQTQKVERIQRAWDLIISGIDYTIKQINKSTGVSARQVSYMKARRSEYLEEGREVPGKWMDVLNEGKENDRFGSEEDANIYINEQAQKWAIALRKEIPVLDSQTKALILARAIIAFSPGRAEEVAKSLIKSLDIWDEILDEARAEVDAESPNEQGF